MLLQTNSYIVPKEKRAAHASLLARFSEALRRLGCDWFETYEQVGTNWDASQSTGRFVQMMRFRNREHQLAVQAGERSDREAQMLIAEFCELINFPYQQDHGFFAVGFYNNILASEEANEATTDAAGEADLDAAFLSSEEDHGLQGFGQPTMRLATDESDSMKLYDDDPVASDGPPGHQSHGSANPGTGRDKSEQQTEPAASDLGQILDAGLLGDSLDIPMPAELLEEDEEPLAPPAPELQIKPRRGMKKNAGRR
jgi:hypothetical protein